MANTKIPSELSSTPSISDSGDATAITIDSSERVGIGTTSPTAKFEVSVAGDPEVKLVNTSTSQTLRLDHNSIRTMTNGALAIMVDDSNSKMIRIDTSGAVTMTGQPAFMAKLGGGTLYSGNVVVYGTTYMNIGSHYNTSNGRFTAPIAGTYLFHWSAIGNSASDVYRYYMYKNGGLFGDSQLRLDTGSGEYGDNGSRIQMLSLAANDYVQIYYTTDGNTVSYTSGDYVNFGGYLIG